MKKILILFLLVVFLAGAVFAQNATKQDAITCLANSVKIMDELRNSGFNTIRVNDTLKIGQQRYAEELKLDSTNKSDYNKVLEQCDNIEKIKTWAYQARDQLFVLNKTYTDFLARVEGFEINISAVERSMNDLYGEMKDERYEKLIEKAPDVRDEIARVEADATTFNLYYKTVSRGLKEFIIDNWIVIVIVIVLIVAFIIFYRVKLRKYVLLNKIKKLELEKRTVQDLIKKTQKDYFELGNMAESEYSIKTKKFAELIRDIERQVPLLKEQVAFMDKGFKLEKSGVEEKIESIGKKQKKK